MKTSKWTWLSGCLTLSNSFGTLGPIKTIDEPNKKSQEPSLPFLFTTGSVNRGEAMFNGELSDLMDFFVHPKVEPHPYYVLSVKILSGKNNHKSAVQYARCMRHADVKMCPVGAMLMYLLLRFTVTDELRHTDFCDSETWLKAKLMVNHKVTRHTNMKKLDHQQYAAVLGEIFEILEVPCSYKCHFGRHEGPVPLEVAEVPSKRTKELRNWGMDIFNSVFSSKAPLMANRAAAGFAREQGTHFNPRTTCIPSATLQRMIHPTLEAHEEKLDANFGFHEKLTARGFLKVLRNSRSVILQDVACLMLEGRTHVLFGLPVFLSPEFLAFKEEMRLHLEACAVTHPVDIDLERVLPTVGSKLTNIHREVRVAQAKTAELKRSVERGFSETHNFVQTLFGNQERLQMQHHQEMLHYHRELALFQQRQRGHQLSSMGRMMSEIGRQQGGALSQGADGPAFIMPPPPAAAPVMPMPPPTGVAGAGATRQSVPAAAAVPEPETTYKTATDLFNHWYGLPSSPWSFSTRC